MAVNSVRRRLSALMVVSVLVLAVAAPLIPFPKAVLSDEGDEMVERTGTTPQEGNHQVSDVDYSALWNRTYGGFDDDRFYALTNCHEGGFAAAGATESFAERDDDIWAVRVDSNGDVLWTMTLDYNNSDDFVDSIYECENGDFILSGSYMGASSINAIVLRIGSEGDLIWMYEIGSAASVDRFYDAIEGSAHNIVAVGSTDNWGAGAEDVLVVSLSPAGQPIWTRTYGGASFDAGYAIVECRAGGYAVGGVTYSSGAGGADFWLLRLDVNGNLEWQETYGGGDNDYCKDIIEYTLGGFLLAGETRSFGDSNGDYYVVRVDSAGSVIWDRHYSDIGPDFATAIVESDRGGFVICGIVNYMSGSDMTKIIRIDPFGTETWIYEYGSTDVDYGFDIIETRPDEFVVAGHTRSYGAGSFDGWLFLVPGPPRMIGGYDDRFMEYGDYLLLFIDVESTAPIDTWWLEDMSVIDIVEGIVYSFGMLEVGDYPVHVHVNNTAGMEDEALFYVYVVDSLAPSWVVSPQDQTLEYGELFEYQLQALDLSGLGDWSIAESHGFEIDAGGLITSSQIPSVGEYTLVVGVEDVWGNDRTATIQLTVEDTTPPDWVEAPENQVIQYGSDFVYDLNATDLSGVASWEVDDMASFSVDYQGRIRSLDLLSPGQHGVTVRAIDIYGNSLTASFVVTVTPSSAAGGGQINLWNTALPFVAGVGATLAVASVVCAASRRSGASK